jgi:DNA-binding NarL/FixJ family response regulator
VALYEQALTLHREVDDRWHLAITLRSLAAALDQQGQTQRAAALVDEAVERSREIGDGANTARSLLACGDLAEAGGDLARAGRHYAEAAVLWRELGGARDLVRVLTRLGRVAARQGDWTAARPAFREALELAHDQGDRDGPAMLLEELVVQLTAAGEPESALRLAGAAAGLRAFLRLPLRGGQRAAYESAVAAAQHELGAERAAAAAAAGRALSWREALDEAVAATAAIGQTTGQPQPPGSEVSYAPGQDPLSRREREVAALIAQGLTSREIAETLIITERTADTHADHIRTKLGLRSRAEIAAWATAHGLRAPTNG